ncbi:hypothetical protein [Faucicola atlantae]|uniref:hypothetical protein n=1 Tax=Faucicola atlantae TaxID=34059 RepID=UPI0025B016DD|nr:hypothetical protein [Moraxella atlantae]
MPATKSAAEAGNAAKPNATPTAAPNVRIANVFMILPFSILPSVIKMISHQSDGIESTQSIDSK